MPPNVACDAFGGSYAADVMSERHPAPVTPRTVDVVRRDRSVETMAREIESIRSIAAAPPSRVLRRFAFMWFRVFVREVKWGKTERVNVRIPIPIPIIGGFFPPGLSRAKALRALALAQQSDDPASAVSDYLDSAMGFELVRVEERKSADHHSLVVVGFD
jgi:hypothetical protein